MSRRDPRGPAFWPDGTKRSRDNVFCTPYGVPINAEELELQMQARKRATTKREAMQREGRDYSTIHGLSVRADLAIHRQRQREKKAASAQ